MKFNYYTLAALPDLTWDGEPPCALSDLLEEFDLQLTSLKGGVSDILLLNDIKNLELILKSKLDIPDEFKGNREGGKIDFYRAGIVEPARLEHFLEDPLRNAPDFRYPDFIIDYFTDGKSNEERYGDVETLYVEYFRYLQTRRDEFIRYYGATASIIRTVISAARMLKQGVDIDKNLRGDPYIVKTIVENKNNADFGLKNFFPEVVDIIALFEKNWSPIEVERELDRIRFKLLEDFGREGLFADYAIYSYIISLQIMDRWNALNDEKGLKILNDIVTGNY